MCEVQDKFDELLAGDPPVDISELVAVVRHTTSDSMHDLAATALFWHDRARQLAIRLACPDRCD